MIGHLSQRQIRYRVQKIHENLCRASQTDMDMILKYWLGVLLEAPCIESLLSNASVELDEQYLPKSVLVSRAAAKIAKQLVTSRKNVTDDLKRTGIDFAVRVGRECSLSTDVRNDIEILSKATSCHWSFSKNVLQAIEFDGVDSLYKRNLKYNAIKATHWPEEILKFVLSEVNSSSRRGASIGTLRC